jgi:hypothetical protein
VTSLRERIEGKTRRTLAFPLQVGDTAAAAADVAAQRGALDLHQQQVRARLDAHGGVPTEDEAKRTIVLRGALKDALARQADTVATIVLQALPDDEWDTVLGGADVDDAGDIVLDDVRAALLAASCVDESLRDEAWWVGQLARPEFSKGDQLALTNALMRLNLNVPDGRQGKG